MNDFFTEAESHYLHDVDELSNWIAVECFGRRADPDYVSRGTGLDVPHLLVRLMSTPEAEELRKRYFTAIQTKIAERAWQKQDEAEFDERMDELGAKVRSLARDIQGPK